MSTRVYVGGLPDDIRQGDVLDIFRRYYPDKCDLKRGYGFLEFTQLRDADDAVHDMDGYKLEGRRLVVQVARGARRGGPGGDRFESRDRPFVPRSNGYRVDVTGIEGRSSWQDLKDFARTAGNVVFADIYVKDGKKIGVIEYSNQQDMENAIRKLDDTKMDGNIVRVTASNPAPASSRADSPPRGRAASPARDRRSRSRSPLPRSRSPPPRARSDSLPRGRAASPARGRDRRSRSRSPRSRSRSRSPPPRAPRSRSRSISPRPSK